MGRVLPDVRVPVLLCIVIVGVIDVTCFEEDPLPSFSLVSIGRPLVRMIPRYCTAAFLSAWTLCIERKARRWCPLRASICWQIIICSCSLACSLQGNVMMGSSERIHVPLEIFSIAMRPSPFPGTSHKACTGLPVELCIFTLLLPVVSTINHESQ